MTFSGDTLTTAQTVAVFHALATASEKARRIMRMAEDSDIAPHDAAGRINSLIVNLEIALAEAHDPAPPVPANLNRDLVS